MQFSPRGVGRGSIIKVENGITRHPAWRMAEPINIEILQGEQIAVVGDNAAGKSRLIEVLTGHYPLLMNEVKYDFSPSPLKMVSENLKYITFRDSYGDADGAYYYQQRWNQHDIDENTPTVRQLLQGVFKEKELENKLTKLFHLEGVMDKYIITLSSGELRKFQLMKALGQGPSVLIMDNPFIGLDAQTRDQLRDLLQQLSEKTYLLIILILSKVDDIPNFITHVIPIEDLHILPKITRQEYQRQLAEKTYAPLPEEKRKWILQLPYKDLKKEDFYPQDGQEILKFNNVSIRYGSRTILKDLNWTVHEGEKWAMSGENGAGKSTLLSLVCADNPQAYACNIELFGHRRGTGESIWQIKRHIGYVSPEMHRAYLKDLPAIDIVASGLHDSVGLYTRPRPEQKQICLDWMNIFGIKELADRTFLKLSSGEQRLCLLARAFVKDPELLILDEPLHGLDLRNRALVKDIIDTFCQRPHKTLIMVTHYKQEFPKCITNSIFLKKQPHPRPLHGEGE